MTIKLKTIGIVDWYDQEKGYGVLKNIHDQREYFIHQSKLNSQVKLSLSEGKIVLFSPDYDQKRNREIVSDIRYFNKVSNVQMAINIWIQEDYLSDTNLEKIFRVYLKDTYKDEHSSFKEAFDHFNEMIWRYLKTDDISGKLFSILKKAILSAFVKEESYDLLEKTYFFLMGKFPADKYFHLLDSDTSPYILFYFAYNSPDYREEAVRKAMGSNTDLCRLLDDLIRFTKDVNEQDTKDSLDGDKSLITNYDFISGLTGGTLVSEIYRYLFSSCDSTKLKVLLKNGYIYSIDNPVLKHDNPDCYKTMMVYAYKEGLVNNIDVEFIQENINKFTASDLIKVKHHCQLSDNDVSAIFLCLVKHIIMTKQEYMYRDVLNLATEIGDLHKWVKDNYSYLAENAETDYQEFMIWLYKNIQIKEIDDSFVNYYIDRFSIDDIFRILDFEQIDLRVKKSILSVLLKDKITSSSSFNIKEISRLCNRSKELLNESYSVWFTDVCSGLNDKDKYVLWRNKLLDICPIAYIRETLLGSEEQGYLEFYDLYQSQMISSVTASDELWHSLNEITIVESRPTFYKILFCIKYLLKINSNYKEAIENVKNDYYTLILWFLFYSSSFEYDILCRLYIYFHPKDQANILKRLFFMAEDRQIQLTLNMLDSLLRVDADLYGHITEQHPELPIDVSSEIVIRAMINLSEKGCFSTDKDVLNIVIRAGQFNKNEKFEIGSFFDECSGRRIYQWDGNRTVSGWVKNIGDSFLGVKIYPYVDVRVFTRGMGYHTENVWNNSFHEAVDAVRNINGRRWNAEKEYWEIPIDEKEKVFEIAKEFGFEIEGTNNSHMRIFREENEGRPARVKYCEGRPALIPDTYVGKDFLWCRNSKCFSGFVKEHSKDEWQNYTLLDFCRIMGLETDSVDSAGRTVKYGKYLNFSSLINRANSIIEHLYCRECGEMLEPLDTSNYHTHLVTHFHCTNISCRYCHEKIYISKCFNWKCNGVIDERDTKKCPNGWNICPDCGSCCSTRTAKQRIDNDIQIGKRPGDYFIDFVNNDRGHLEKRQFYCWKCGKLMNYLGDSVYICQVCEVRYDRKRYDFVPRHTTVTS